MDVELPLRLLGLDPVDTTGPPDVLASRHEVTALLTASVATAAAGHRRLQHVLGREVAVAVDTRRAAAAGASQVYARVDGQQPPAAWAALSGLARARDGWVRLHANYPHHAEALCRVLGIRPERAALDAAVAGRDAVELESALAGSGGVGVAVRSREQWADHPQSRVADPLLDVADRGPAHAPDRRPRVLDLTRVLAGPVATRLLGLGGADVLRLDRPDRAEVDLFADTGLAKRSALLDLRAVDVEPLLAGADVVVLGYRPDALPTVRAALERHPGVVVVELSAWGWTGPWRDRRGFDSLVQAAVGINLAEGSGDAPGALPVQALDHATGYLAAACAWHGLAARATDGVARRYRLSLAQTARWLGPPRENACAATDPWVDLQSLPSGYGPCHVLAPPFTADGALLGWPSGAQRPGTADAVWLAGPSG